MTRRARLRHFAATRHWALAAALALLAASLVLPPVPLSRDTFSYLVTLDITQSMDTEDVTLDGAPASRLAFAKASMREALASLPCGSKIGWSIFTGQSTLVLVPPIEVCRNFDALIASLEGIDGRMRWTNWSRIAEGGVYSAVRVAHEIGQGTAVVFVTDGQEAPPLLPSNAPERDIAVPGVGGWLIGVGGDEPAPIPRTDENGDRRGYWSASDVVQIPPAAREPAGSESHEELSALRGQYLANLAARIGFGYRRLLGPASIAEALGNARYARRMAVPTDVRWIPALLALALLAWRYLPALRRPRRARAIREFLPAAPVASETRNGLP
ncbi:MxaL protein [Trinickia caryophylli]|uniref:MxaL protein n=1 Tax=Trinickia caryophylli TaxID=28094 RepID=A0A1X7E1U5_TRICW|nr:MxaL protein [Trinickia caryophylli]WQE11496.1 MxaL protein [Trinickia caryophylli]GLU32660.1 hypothetical protein Busp01_25020 [Trinickia caryophylli]SMF25783.1 mxaL protein [Trinickia caryophylli]